MSKDYDDFFGGYFGSPLDLEPSEAEQCDEDEELAKLLYGKADLYDCDDDYFVSTLNLKLPTSSKETPAQKKARELREAEQAKEINRIKNLISDFKEQLQKKYLPSKIRRLTSVPNPSLLALRIESSVSSSDARRSPKPDPSNIPRLDEASTQPSIIYAASPYRKSGKLTGTISAPICLRIASDRSMAAPTSDDRFS